MSLMLTIAGAIVLAFVAMALFALLVEIYDGFGLVLFALGVFLIWKFAT